MIVLVVSVLLVTWPIALFNMNLFSFWLLADTTLLHLVLVTIFVLLEPFLKRLFALALLVSNLILIKQAFDFACGFTVITYWSSGSIVFINIVSVLLKFHLFLFVDLFLINMFFVLLRTTLWRMVNLRENFRRKSKGRSGFSVIQVMPGNNRLCLWERIYSFFLSLLLRNVVGTCFSHRWVEIGAIIFGRLKRESIDTIILSLILMIVALNVPLLL